MGKLKLFIATSLDGFIARKNGAIDWLFTDGDYNYWSFYRSIGITLMGRKTYELALSTGEIPYPEKKNYIFTRDKTGKHSPYAEYIDDPPAQFVRNLKLTTDKDLWVVGGGELIKPLYEDGLIDEYIIAIHPIILGEGIPLFFDIKSEQKLRLFSHQVFPNGLVQLFYEKVKRYGYLFGSVRPERNG